MAPSGPLGTLLGLSNSSTTHSNGFGAPGAQGAHGGPKGPLGGPKGPLGGPKGPLGGPLGPLGPTKGSLGALGGPWAPCWGVPVRAVYTGSLVLHVLQMQFYLCGTARSFSYST